MSSQSTVPPVSGSDDARSAETDQAENDGREALIRAERNVSAADARDTEIESHRLAREYIRLGGHRRSKIDDNITDVRLWEQDPPEAELFWKERVETLSKADRKQVEDFLPTINTP